MRAPLPAEVLFVAQRLGCHSERINAKPWAKNVAQKMIEETEGIDSLRIQEESFNKAKKLSQMKLCYKICETQRFKRVLILDSVRDVLGVELTDQLLAIHGRTEELLDT